VGLGGGGLHTVQRRTAQVCYLVYHNLVYHKLNFTTFVMLHVYITIVYYEGIGSR
jgi:hypothetical protein